VTIRDGSGPPLVVGGGGGVGGGGVGDGVDFLVVFFLLCWGVLLVFVFLPGAILRFCVGVGVGVGVRERRTGGTNTASIFCGEKEAMDECWKGRADGVWCGCRHICASCVCVCVCVCAHAKSKEGMEREEWV
jgi:hypothetical protein